MALRVKICGITNLEQGQAIAKLGAAALGFMLVPSSPRYISPAKISSIIPHLPADLVAIGVFADTDVAEIAQIVAETHLTAVQLHGQETPAYCQELRRQLPLIEIIKALRIRDSKDLAETAIYEPVVDTLLLDAYHPQLLGGTGHSIDWAILKDFAPSRPWFLAGGLNPDNIMTALGEFPQDKQTQRSPHGIDLSSGVEITPGDKDLNKVEQLFQYLRQNSYL